MTKVYDCFMFNGEWDILELRLNTHDPVVDYFVIVESCYTFVGELKHLAFDVTNPIVKDFLHKIRYVLVTDMPNTGNPWHNEIHQRDCIVRGLWDASAQDLVIINDCDEIIKPHCIQQAIGEYQFDFFGFQQPMYYCFMNYRMTGHYADKVWSVAVRKHMLDMHSATHYRGAIGSGQHFVFGNAGWHYSYMMDLEQIKNKIRNFSHQEFNNSEFLNSLDPVVTAKQNQDLLGRDYITWQKEDPSQVDLPVYVRQNLDKYKKYLLE